MTFHRSLARQHLFKHLPYNADSRRWACRLFQTETIFPAPRRHELPEAATRFHLRRGRPWVAASGGAGFGQRRRPRSTAHGNGRRRPRGSLAVTPGPAAPHEPASSCSGQAGSHTGGAADLQGGFSPGVAAQAALFGDVLQKWRSRCSEPIAAHLGIASADPPGRMARAPAGRAFTAAAAGRK